ncbi:aspartate/glutamate racemase family protein [Aquimarina intermedia]|uniref:aspartate/glutamate racemase family protein n=1 Tax=Aquimarina intermedia TaxID=350814 RepID=UPI0011E78853|nr:amino acid racemase [Aquimarina intermedia]
MNTNKIIGIIGGMGPEAGIELHRRVIHFSEASRDQEHFSIVHVGFPSKVVDRTQYLEHKTIINPAQAILEMVHIAVNSGATVLGIACNTAHAPQIFEPVKMGLSTHEKPVNLVNMVEEACVSCIQEVPLNSKIGILSSNGVFKSELYSAMLQHRGFEIVLPSPKFQEEVIHNMIYNSVFGIKSNSTILRTEVLELLHKAMRFYLNNDVQTIILGCTEFSLLKEVLSIAYPNILVIDTIDVLAKALIREASKPVTA